MFDATVNGIFSIISVPDCSLMAYRNATDFCLLTLYPASLLNSYISSKRVLFGVCVEFLG